MAHVTVITNEPRRGCGYRKEGGLYLMAGQASAPCGKLPFPLETCPTCGGGIKPARGWTWINPRALMADTVCRRAAIMHLEACDCPLWMPDERAGLLWIGEKFYPTPEDFLREARELGISRRINSVPKNFEIGKTWVYFAHRRGMVRPVRFENLEGREPGDMDMIPAIVGTFRPSRIEYIIKGTETEKELDRLEARGLTLVKLERTYDDQGNGVLEFAAAGVDE